jgi:hypothetical protein
MSREDYRQLFMGFVAGLLGDFDRYLSRDDIDFLRDGVSFRMAGMWLDDAEFAELMRDIARAFQPRLANAPRAGRRRRIIGSVLLPGEEAVEAAGVASMESSACAELPGEDPR